MIKKNWLLLRGLAREKRHWGEFSTQLGSHLTTLEGGEAQAHVQIFALDLPGAGTESHRFSPLSVRGIVEDLRQRWIPLRRQNDGEWNILGVSLGGMVAMDWCGHHPFEFRRLVCINASSASFSRPDQRLKPAAWQHLATAVLARTALKKEKAVLRMVSNKQDHWPDTAEAWARLATQTPVKPVNAVAQLFAASLAMAPEDLTPACLFLSSAGDGMVDPSCSRLLAEHFRAPLVVHPSAGHELTLDEPGWVCEQIANWIRHTRGPETVLGHSV